MPKLFKRMIVTAGLFSTLLAVNPLGCLPVTESAIPTVHAEVIPGDEPKG